MVLSGPEHLKAGGWAIADIPNFKYATNIEFIEIAGEYTDKTSSAGTVHHSS